MRTPRSGASASAGSWDHVTHMGGAPGTTVTPRSRMVSSAVTGSKRCTRTALAPTWSVRSATTVRPMMWLSGRTPNTTSSGPSRSLSVERIWPRLASRLPCESIAAAEAPAVPLVNISRASVSPSTSTGGTGAVVSSSSKVCAPSRSCPGVATTETIAPVTDGWTDCHAAAAIGPTTAATGETSDSWRSISGPGLVGLRGTATAPSPTVARRAMMKYGSLPDRRATRSPGPTPRSSSAPRNAAVRSRSAP